MHPGVITHKALDLPKPFAVVEIEIDRVLMKTGQRILFAQQFADLFKLVGGISVGHDRAFQNQMFFESGDFFRQLMHSFFFCRCHYRPPAFPNNTDL